MIAIVKVGHIKDNIYKYEVRINKKYITDFEHDRRKGLSVCLRLASHAVEKFELDNFIKIIEKTVGEYW